MSHELPIIQGRGAGDNPRNRFETMDVHRDLEQLEGEEGLAERLSRVKTQFLVDTSRSIIATNDSPDVGFEASVNPYRGCEHGCIYCFARPTHEYLGFSAGLDFETKIMVKRDAPALLRAALMKPSWIPKPLQISGVTDCYQPIERTLRLTRGCLEVLAEFRHPVTMLTKNFLVTRDIDLLKELAKYQAVAVGVSITTLDAELARKMEPRTSAPRRRIEAIRLLRQAGIPVAVMAAPLIPGLNDHEVPAILKAAADAGATAAGYVPLRLPGANAQLFTDWLATHYPSRKDKILNRIRDMRGGKLYSSEWGQRMVGQGIWATQLKAMFEFAKKNAGITGGFPKVSSDAFRRPGGAQMSLWGD